MEKLRSKFERERAELDRTETVVRCTDFGMEGGDADAVHDPNSSQQYLSSQGSSSPTNSQKGKGKKGKKGKEGSGKQVAGVAGGTKKKLVITT